MMMRNLTVRLALMLGIFAALPQPVSSQDTAPSSGREARVQPGDRVTVRIFREPDLSGTVTVGLDGEVVLPRLGRVYVADRTAGEVQEDLRTAYARYLRNASVEVVVLRRIGVHGEVRRPDLYVVDLTTTLRDVITMAGGLTPEAHPGRIYVVREGQRITFDGPDVAQMATSELRSGDQVVVGQRGWIQRNPIGTASGAVGLVVATIGLLNVLRK
jgi:protein involved in polysaccharide export with SLBB domain